MAKITLSVSKTYKNTGSFRFHRKKTSKHWKHYFLDDDSGEWRFNTEWVDSVTAQFLKLRKYHKMKFLCIECGNWYIGFVRKEKDKTECPYCDEE